MIKTKNKIKLEQFKYLKPKTNQHMLSTGTNEFYCYGDSMQSFIRDVNRS